MLSKNLAFVLTLFLIVLSLGALAIAPAVNPAAVTGRWNGDMNGVRAVTLDLQEKEGKLNGTILFYLIRHNDGKPPRSSPGAPEPLIGPVFDGKVLTFKVSHKNAHPPQTLNDPPVSFHFELLDANKGRLTREGGEVDSSAELIRGK